MNKAVLIIVVIGLPIIAGISIFYYMSLKQDQQDIQEIHQKINGIPYIGLAEDCNYEDAAMQTCCIGSVYDMQQLGGFLSTSAMCDGAEINTPECPGAYSWCIPQKEEDTNAISEDEKICEVDSDCVPAQCCHATDVINKEFAPNCEGMMCTMSCETVLDCGGGQPVCSNGMCTIEIK
ncbi:MAG: hypothetical protein ACKUBY_06090 [Candidatus Moraniibacteriota bacterium]